MDATTSVGEEASRDLRDQIGQTQRSLNQKIDRLGGEVRHVAGEFTHTVTDRVSAARRALLPTDWVRARPILMCVGAVAVGVLLGRRDRTESYSGDVSVSKPIRGEVAKVVLPILVGLTQSVGRQALEGFIARSRRSAESSRQG